MSHLIYGIKKVKNNAYCTNCGKKGHDFKGCIDPITSYGIILIKLDGELLETKLNLEDEKLFINMNGIRAIDNKDIELFSKINYNIKFLMIRRRHTLGYIEFVRGRYRPDNVDGIIFLFQQMTETEIKKIGTLTFQELWEDFWGNSEKKKILEFEYCKSKENFELLKNNKNELNLSFYVENVKPSWNEAEWGFPKGRRSKNEMDIVCAKREFEEESGFNSDDYCVYDNIEPLVEDFIGTNGIKYRHVYYVAKSTSNKIPKIDDSSSTQGLEIGAIDYCTYYDGIKLIRNHHVARKNIMTKLYNYIMNNVIINTNKLE